MVWRGLLVGLMVLGGCIEPQLVECASGLACPRGSVCDDIHGSCATPAQLAVCAEAAEGTDCTAGPISGGCFDGVCLVRGCGNRIVEVDEVCDDGNQTSRDGCRGDCSSTEVCGNGVLDSDEVCDDANLVSRDGCDSGCRDETSTWTVDYLLPSGITRHRGAYDELRGRLVLLAASSATWEWDHVRWRKILDGIGEPDAALVWDPDRGHVVRVSSTGVATWDGSVWSTVATTNAPSISTRVTLATYDPIRRQIVVVFGAYSAPSTAWTFDGAGDWQPIPLPGAGPDLSTGGTLAHDTATNEIVLITDGPFSGPGTPSTMWIITSTGAVSSSVMTGGPQSPGTLVNDPVRGLLLLGGYEPPVASQQVRVRQGTTWTPNASLTLPAPRTGLLATYAAATTSVIAAGGSVPNSAAQLATTDEPIGDVWQLTAGTWAIHHTGLPSAISGFAFAADPLGQRFLAFGGFGVTGTTAETWAWDGAWTRVVTAHSPPARYGAVMAFDPGRGGIVMCCGSPVGDTWLFSGGDWTPLDVTGDPPFNAVAMTYDSDRRRIVVVRLSSGGAGTLHALGSEASEWRILTDTPGVSFDDRPVSVGWNALSARLLITARDGEAFELADDTTPTWNAIPSPGRGFVAVSNPRRGSAMMIGIDLFASEPTIWEVRGASLTRIGQVPVPRMRGTAAIDPRTGDLVVVGTGGGDFTLASLRVTSETALETCAPAQDTDGDGLTSCVDGDCFWACSETCPPFTSCP